MAPNQALTSKAGFGKELDGGKLFYAGFVYDIPAIAKMYKLNPASKCWRVLLTSKSGEAKLEVCSDPSKHGGVSSDVHTHPANWKISEVNKHRVKASKSQCEAAGWTVSEKKKVKI